MWFKKHLNWTYLIIWLIGGSLFGGGDTLVETDYWLGLIMLWLGVVVLWANAIWVIRRKGRSLWWLALVWAFSPLWLKNKRAG